MSINSIILSFTLVFLTQNLSSAELYEPGQSVRALAMGGAYSAVVRDRDALFYNPAGLNQVEGFYVSLFDLDIGLNGESAVETVNNLSDAADLSEQLDALYGNPIWLGFGAQAAFYMKNFGFTYYDAGYVNLALENPTFPTFNVTYFNDLGYAFGLSFNMTPAFALGITARRLTRSGGMVPVGIETLQSLNSNDVTDSINQNGTGLGLDVGMLWYLPTGIPSRLALVYRNVGDTSFQSTTDGGTDPAGIKSELMLGWAMDIEAPGLIIRPAFDYKHINKTSEPLGKKLHFGVEVDLPLITVRGGFSQGYYTWGAGLGLGPLDIEFATYGVELGEYPGQDEDRRYMLQIAMELGFDMDFNFSDFGSVNRRKLKQRR
ncbi:MAG: hypothetical protein AB8E15_06975 [Bdellovibrionales bacterium]